MNKIITAVVCMIFINIAIAQNKVGIGTNSPAEKLHANGNIKTDTIKSSAIKFMPDAGVGKILSSDFAGNAIVNFELSVAIDGASKRFVIGAYKAVPGGKAIFGKIN
jgi:hypothetical protein